MWSHISVSPNFNFHLIFAKLRVFGSDFRILSRWCPVLEEEGRLDGVQDPSKVKCYNCHYLVTMLVSALKRKHEEDRFDEDYK